MKKDMQKDVLKWLLGRVYRAERHKKELEERLERIIAERESPIGPVGYDPLPRVQEPGSGAASILYKLAGIEERIYEQKSEIEKSYVRVMDIIDFIPPGDPARRIFELRHLDCLGFNRVAESIPMSRSRCYAIYNQTIDALLQYPKIRKMIQDSEDQYIDWYARTKK